MSLEVQQPCFICKETNFIPVVILRLHLSQGTRGKHEGLSSVDNVELRIVDDFKKMCSQNLLEKNELRIYVKWSHKISEKKNSYALPQIQNLSNNMYNKSTYEYLITKKKNKKG